METNRRRALFLFLAIILILVISACSKNEQAELSDDTLGKNNKDIEDNRSDDGLSGVNDPDGQKTGDGGNGQKTGDSADGQKPGDGGNVQNDATPTPTPTPVPWDGAYIDRESFIKYKVKDLDNIFSSVKDQLDESEYLKVSAAVSEGTSAINASATVKEAEKAYSDTYNAILDIIPEADGTYSYENAGFSEKTDILGVLENYGIANGLTGISIYENCSHIIFNKRVQPGCENYITGYGFGTLAEGTINSALESEKNEAWKRYYHTYQASDTGSVNALNDSQVTTEELYEYISAHFFNTFLNPSKDGYEWVRELALSDMEPVDDQDGDGICTTWRMEVRTGSDGLRYKTGSVLEDRSAFDGREVELEDYESAFKMLLTQANGFLRGGELAGISDGSGIYGAKEYYEASASGYDEALWENVGIKTFDQNGKNYLQVEFIEPQTRFYAMSFLSASVFMPVPEDFLKLVGTENYLGFNADGTETPVDNSLSLGPFYLEKYDRDSQIVFAKNPYYVFADTKFCCDGLHIRIMPEAGSDKNAAYREFLAGNLDAATVPKEYLYLYKDDSRLKETVENSNFKLNINSCDSAMWEYLFGENGKVCHTDADDYWEVKPVLNNMYFRKALSLAIDRLKFSEICAARASADYFTSNYISDPEKGISYKDTDSHKNAVSQLLDGTDGYGFSQELAQNYFRMALTELEAEGSYAPGTKENPTEICLEIAWMFASDEEDFHDEIKEYLESAFNDERVSGGAYILRIDFWSGDDWSDVYYEKMFRGQYDIAYGSVSGNVNDPLRCLKVLSSDPLISEKLTLNWNVDTNDPEVYPLVYDGLRWSFDALFNAANGVAHVEKGRCSL